MGKQARARVQTVAPPPPPAPKPQREGVRVVLVNSRGVNTMEPRMMAITLTKEPFQIPKEGAV